jgi:V/A-type H+-transporting ATPase subunit E
MATENITAKILADAKEKAQELLAEAEGKVKEILESARTEAQQLDEKLGREAADRAKKEATRIISLAEMEEKKRILEEKIVILEDAFRKALEHLRSRPEIEYRQTMKELILGSVDHGDEEVVVARKDKERLTQDFLNSINDELRKAGRKGQLTLAGEYGDFGGGVLLKRDRVETWCSLEVLLNTMKGDLEMQIAELLFKSGE